MYASPLRQKYTHLKPKLEAVKQPGFGEPQSFELHSSTEAINNCAFVHDDNDTRYNSTSGSLPKRSATLSSSHDRYRPKLTKRLGTYLITTNIAALILIVAVANIITFLWFGDRSNSLWRRIMIDGWAGQVVTLSTLAIRLAISTQAVTALGMLASVLIEEHGVLLHNAPSVSIARCTNNGPLLSLLPFWRELRTGNARVVFALVASLALTTSVLQLSSTILLWDIRPGLAHGFEASEPAMTGYNLSTILYDSLVDSSLLNGIIRHTPNYWTSIPQVFPTFAEWSQPAASSNEAVMDTGPTIRALLPIQSETDRSLLNTYSGPATLFDSRVICVRPNIADLKFSSIYSPKNASFGESTPPIMRGSISPVVFPPYLAKAFQSSNASSGIPFQCEAGPLWLNGSNVVQLCGLQYQAGGLINDLDPSNNDTVTQFYDEKEQYWKASSPGNNSSWNIELGHAYLLLNYTLNLKGWSEWAYGNLTNSSLTSSNYDFKNRGPWADYISSDETEPLFSASLCYDAMYYYRAMRIIHPQDFDIVATRVLNSSEPIVGSNSINSRFNTSELQKQLGVSKETLTTGERGVLDIDMSGLETQLQVMRKRWDPNESTAQVIGTALTRYYAPSPNTQLTYDFLNSLIWRQTESTPLNVVVFCDKCILFYDNTPNSDLTFLSSLLSDLFVSVLNDTQNPALAMQSLLTSLMRMAYYEWLPTFNVRQDLKVQAFKDCQMPQRARGFTILAVVLLTHLIFVTVVMLLFLKRTRFSMLNNAWQAVAQVTTPASGAVLAKASMMEDRDIRSWVNADDSSRRRYSVRRMTDGKRVGIE